MASAGGHQGQFDGLQVAQFPHQDDVGVLTQGTAKSRGKRLGVDADLTVVDEAGLALMDKFDGVFNGDDMVPAVLVRIIDHGGESCRFAGASWSRDHNQTAMQHAELLKHAWQRRVELLKILEGKDLGWNLAEDGSDAILLVVEISPETGNRSEERRVGKECRSRWSPY